MKIKQATTIDMPHILKMIELCEAESVVSKYGIKFDLQATIKTVGDFICHDDKVCLISPNGLFMLYVAPFRFSADLVLFDETFFVEKESRGGFQAYRLYQAAIKFAKEKKCKGLEVGTVTGVSTENTNSFYERLGCVRLGDFFYKELK